MHDIPKNWCVVPFGDQRIKGIKEAFDVIGIPQLVVLDAKRETILDLNARKQVFEDEDGSKCL